MVTVEHKGSGEMVTVEHKGSGEMVAVEQGVRRRLITDAATMHNQIM
jgi:hypothetical protein